MSNTDSLRFNIDLVDSVTHEDKVGLKSILLGQLGGIWKRDAESESTYTEEGILQAREKDSEAIKKMMPALRVEMRKNIKNGTYDNLRPGQLDKMKKNLDLLEFGRPKSGSSTKNIEDID